MAEADGQRDVLRDVERLDEVEALEDDADVAAAEARRGAVGHRGEVRAADLDATGVGREQAGEQVQQRGLARAARAHHGLEGAGGELEGKAAEDLGPGLAGAEGLAERGRADRGRGGESGIVHGLRQGNKRIRKPVCSQVPTLEQVPNKHLREPPCSNSTVRDFYQFSATRDNKYIKITHGGITRADHRHPDSDRVADFKFSDLCGRGRIGR